MTKELLFKAQDLSECISGNQRALRDEQEKIEKLKRLGSRMDGTITIHVNEEIGLASVLVEDIIKASEKRCEMLKELIDKQQKEFDAL